MNVLVKSQIGNGYTIEYNLKLITSPVINGGMIIMVDEGDCTFWFPVNCTIVETLK